MMTTNTRADFVSALRADLNAARAGGLLSAVSGLSRLLAEIEGYVPEPALIETAQTGDPIRDQISRLYQLAEEARRKGSWVAVRGFESDRVSLVQSLAERERTEAEERALKAPLEDTLEEVIAELEQLPEALRLRVIERLRD
jgi:hypothetical protein